MIKKILYYLICFFLVAGTVWAQVNVTQDILPNTNTPDSTAILNNQLRQQQNAINTVGAYFNGNGYLTEANGGTGTNLSAFSNGSLLIQDSADGIVNALSQGTSGQYLESQGANVDPIWITPPVILAPPKTLIGNWTDTVGASISNTGQATNNTTIIDSGTDWAGKNVTVIATMEARVDTSFTAVFPIVKNTSTTALSAMQFSSSSPWLGFVIYTLTLPSNSFTTLIGNGTSGTTCGVGIGTNNLGNLTLGTGISSSGTAFSCFSKFSGTILRAP